MSQWINTCVSMEWQPTPVFLPEKLHGLRRLVGYSPWGHKESDTTELLHFKNHCGSPSVRKRYEARICAYLRLLERNWVVLINKFAENQSLPPWASQVLLVVKNLPANAENPGLIPGLERYPGEGNGNPLQCSCLEKSMHREAWWATVHGASKSQTQLSTNTSLNSWAI